MDEQASTRGRRRLDARRRRERAERILDAATSLAERWGFDKTAMEDIAREAGVAKGTIYHHWSSREDLFICVLLRECLQMVEELQAQVQHDPEGLTLHGLVKYSVLATVRRPLPRALLLTDSRTLGSIARHEYLREGSLMRRRMDFLRDLLVFLREEGMVRTDLSLEDVLHTLGAICIGFMTVEHFWPEGVTIPPERQCDLLAEATRRTLETGRQPTPEHQERLSRFLEERLGQMVTMVRAYLQQHLEEVDDGSAD